MFIFGSNMTVFVTFCWGREGVAGLVPSTAAMAGEETFGSYLRKT